MKLSELKLSGALKVLGAVGMLAFGFAPWIRFDSPNLVGSFDNAFSYPVRGALPWLLVIGVGVVTLLELLRVKLPSLAWPLITLLASALAAILLFLLILTPGHFRDSMGNRYDLDPAFGLWMSFISSLVALAGSVKTFLESGGKLKDLTDVDTLKRGFGKD